LETKTVLNNQSGQEVFLSPPLATTENLPARATTTTEEDMHSASQRKINLIWESTQMAIALIVVTTAMAAGLYTTFSGTEKAIPTILSVAFGTVVGFYFGRTNHQYVGGVQIGR
jgi:hypothetical protein